MRHLLSILMFGVSEPALAAPPSPDDHEQTVVVTAAPSLDRQVKNFVGALAPHWTGQISRFEATLCPKAINLSAVDAAVVESRLRSVATSLGIAVGRADCHPNVLIVATPDKRAFLKAVYHRKPDLLGDMEPDGFRQLLRSPGYAASWQLGGMVAYTGQVMSAESGAQTSRLRVSATRLQTPLRPVFDAGVLVVEQRALRGLTMIQLADYTAMRLLAGADPKRAMSLSEPTIMRVLDAPDGSVVPAGLTKWDAAYLRGLYTAREFVSGSGQRSDIRHNIERTVGAGQPGR